MIDRYVDALGECLAMNKKEWLATYFAMYKTTLIWPPGLPPIRTCDLDRTHNRYKRQFHELYAQLLRDFEYTLDCDTKTLTLHREREVLVAGTDCAGSVDTDGI